MPTLSESFEAAKARAVEDFNEVKRQLQVVVDASNAKDAIIEQMSTTHVEDQAAIDSLNAQTDALNQQIADAQAAIDAFDLDASFPPAPPSGDTGGGDQGTGEPPVAPDPGVGSNNPTPPPAPGEDIPVGTGAGDIGGAPPAPPEVTNPDTAPEPSTGPVDGSGEPAPTNGGVGTEPAPETPPGE